MRLVPLAEAREKAVDNRKIARERGDPLVEKRRAGWRGPKEARNWLASLERYAFPRIAKVPLSEITSADVLTILTPIWHVKMETARLVRHRIRTVLEWAIVMEFRMENP